MPLPRARFTARQFVLAAAIVVHLLAIACHPSGAKPLARFAGTAFAVLAIDWLMMTVIGSKYDRAARRPFLPVAPDPPAPE